MLSLLTLLACSPPKISLDSGLGDRTVDGTTDGGASDGGATGGEDTGGGDDGGDGTGGGGDDTGTGGSDTGGSDTGGTGGTGGGDTGATDTGTAGTEPEPDYSTFYGGRSFVQYDWDGTTVVCEERIEEVGTLLDESWEFYEDYYADAEAACPTCDYFYEVALSADSVCGLYFMSNPGYIGIDINTATIDVYAMNLEFDVWSWDYVVTSTPLTEGAAFDGWSFEYSYEDWLGYMVIEGWAEFPEK